MDCEIIVVYIEEAHSTNRWPLGYSFEKPSAPDSETKIKYAREFVSNFEWSSTCLVDTNKEVQTALRCWPAKYFVIDRNMLITYIGESSKYSQGYYDINKLLSFIKNKKQQ